MNNNNNNILIINERQLGGLHNDLHSSMVCTLGLYRHLNAFNGLSSLIYLSVKTSHNEVHGMALQSLVNSVQKEIIFVSSRHHGRTMSANLPYHLKSFCE